MRVTFTSAAPQTQLLALALEQAAQAGLQQQQASLVLARFHTIRAVATAQMAASAPLVHFLAQIKGAEERARWLVARLVAQAERAAETQPVPYTARRNSTAEAEELAQMAALQRRLERLEHLLRLTKSHTTHQQQHQARLAELVAVLEALVALFTPLRRLLAAPLDTSAGAAEEERSQGQPRQLSALLVQVRRAVAVAAVREYGANSLPLPR